MESRRRSIAKALSWRFLAMLITASVAYLFTNEASFAITIGIADSVIKILVYYLHERAWIRSSFGRLPEPGVEDAQPQPAASEAA